MPRPRASTAAILKECKKFTGDEKASEWYRDFKDTCSTFGLTTDADRDPLLRQLQADKAKKWSTVLITATGNAGVQAADYIEAWTERWIGTDRNREIAAVETFRNAKRDSDE